MFFFFFLPYFSLFNVDSWSEAKEFPTNHQNNLQFAVLKVQMPTQDKYGAYWTFKSFKNMLHKDPM